jgi:hypothetical protein
MSFTRTTALALIPMLLATAGLADSITASAQPAGATLIIDEVTIDGDGWLVIHAMKDGKPVVPGSIGRVALKAGTSKSLTVTLDAPVASGDVVLTMLHADKGAMGTYEFPGADKPVMSGGKPVVKPLKIN